MKSVMILCFFAIFAQEVLSDEAASKQTCIHDIAISPNMVDKAYNGEISNNRELKCFFKCYYEKEGLMDDKGNVKPDKLVAKMPKGTNPTIGKKAVDLCKEYKGKDSCETAYLVQKCLLNNNIKI